MTARFPVAPAEPSAAPSPAVALLFGTRHSIARRLSAPDSVFLAVSSEQGEEGAAFGQAAEEIGLDFRWVESEWHTPVGRSVTFVAFPYGGTAELLQALKRRNAAGALAQLRGWLARPHLDPLPPAFPAPAEWVPSFGHQLRKALALSAQGGWRMGLVVQAAQAARLGRVLMESGRIVAARAASERGADALSEMAWWQYVGVGPCVLAQGDPWPDWSVGSEVASAGLDIASL